MQFVDVKAFLSIQRQLNIFQTSPLALFFARQKSLPNGMAHLKWKQYLALREQCHPYIISIKITFCLINYGIKRLFTNIYSLRVCLRFLVPIFHLKFILNKVVSCLYGLGQFAITKDNIKKSLRYFEEGEKYGFPAGYYALGNSYYHEDNHAMFCNSAGIISKKLK